MGVIESFDRVAADVDRLIAGIGPGQFRDPTPCEGWDVWTLVNHIVTGNLLLTSVMTGAPPPDRTVDHLGADPLGAYRESVRAFRDAGSAEGALDRVYASPLGEVAGELLVHARINELLVHGWDVAHATDQPADLDPDLAEEALAMWQARLRGPRPAGGPFGAAQPTPPEADAVDRLVSFLGRQV